MDSVLAASGGRRLFELERQARQSDEAPEGELLLPRDGGHDQVAIGVRTKKTVMEIGSQRQ
jgi:hypothetical protein